MVSDELTEFNKIYSLLQLQLVGENSFLQAAQQSMPVNES